MKSPFEWFCLFVSKISLLFLYSGAMELVVEDHLEQTGGIGHTKESRPPSFL